MNAISTSALFTEVTPDESAVVNGGFGGFGGLGGFDFSPYYGDLFANYPIAGFDPAFMWQVRQETFPIFSGYLVDSFSNGSSMYDGLFAITDLVRWAGSPL